MLLYFSYFDAHGNYYEKKDPNQIQDNWLDGVDWGKVRYCCSDCLPLSLLRLD